MPAGGSRGKMEPLEVANPKGAPETGAQPKRRLMDIRPLRRR